MHGEEKLNILKNSTVAVFGVGGHGSSDDILREDIFGNPAPDSLNRAASHVCGVAGIITGICANKSMSRCMPVKV